MHGCWAYDPVQRPNFSALVIAFAGNLAENAEYFTFSMSPVPASQGETMTPEITEEQCTIFSNSPIVIEHHVSSSEAESVASNNDS